MLLRLICAGLFFFMASPAESAPREIGVQEAAKDKTQSTSKKCGKKEPAISEEQAIDIAKAEVLKRIGEKGSKDFTRYEASTPTSKLYPNEYWYVFTMPDTREIDAHISSRINRCGKVLYLRHGV